MARRVSFTLLLTASGFRCSLRCEANNQLPPPPQPDSQDVVRITTNLVQIDVVVTKDGKPVTGSSG
jgi:hypothetical protein